ncbi:MAG TPA: hypothetical protein VF463_19675 [Sphingobium sp.]
MDEGINGDTGPIDFQRDDTENDGLKVDAIANAIAPLLVFNAVALPPELPDDVKAAVIAKADQARDAAVEAGFVLPSANGPSDGKTPEERKKEREEKSLSYASLMMDEMEDQRKREEAHYAEWRQSSHTYAGQTMDGEQWHRLMNWFRDPANVTAWEDAMMAQTGQSREEVRQTGGKMKRFYDLMEKDARGTLTGAEKSEFDKLNDDRDVKQGVAVQQETQGMQQSRTVGVLGASETNYNGANQEKATSFASTFADDGNVSGGSKLPELTSLYHEAANGKPKNSSPEPSAMPGLPPAQIVQVSPDNMFG